MGSPIAAMLAQAAPVQGAAPAAPTPGTDVSKMTPEQLAAYMKSLGIESPAAPTPTPSPSPTPLPAPPPKQSFAEWLLGKLGLAPSTASLVPQGQPTPPPPTAEGLAQRNKGISGQ